MLYTNKSCVYHGSRVPHVRIAFFGDHILMNENVDAEGTVGAIFCKLCLLTFGRQYWIEDNLDSPEIIDALHKLRDATWATQPDPEVRAHAKSMWDDELMRRQKWPDWMEGGSYGKD